MNKEGFVKMWDSNVKRNVLIVLLSFLGLILLTYEYGVIASYKYYAPGTVINNKYVGLKSIDYADQALYENPSEYTLKMKFRDQDYLISGYDIDLNYSYREDLENIKKGQSPFMWPMYLSAPDHKIKKKITFDRNKLVEYIDSFESMQSKNMKKPKNPTIELNDDGVVVAVPQDPGSVIEDKKEVYKAAVNAVNSEEKELDIDEAGLYKISRYTVDSAKVKQCVDRCNRIVGLGVKYYYGDTELELEPYQLFGTIKISDKYDMIISRQKVQEMLESFSRLHDTYSSIRKFKNHNHKYISITNSDYGWEMDIENETDALYKDMIHHKSVSREPAMLHTGFTYNKKGDDIGGTYAEVSLDEQMMFFYKDNRLVLSTEVVTGNINLGRSTPPGIYNVDYHQTPATLKGEDYETKVTYWMPFNGGIGFHDATWRGIFGGDIYTYDGSHGCVNMPYSSAEELFFEIEDGTPVIVY